MQEINRSQDIDTRLKLINDNFAEARVMNANKDVYVSTVEELEAAVAIQKPGQTIWIQSGVYALTESLAIPTLAYGGALVGLGSVKLNGAADADEAILVAPEDYDTASWTYRLENLNIQGGANKNGLQVTKDDSTLKLLLTIVGGELYDNGTGKGLVSVNTDTENAVRIYATDVEFNDVDITSSDGGDKFIARQCTFNENVVIANVDTTLEVKLIGCEVKHEGITGGHTNNVVASLYSWSNADGTLAAVDADEFPGAITATIVPA